MSARPRALALAEAIRALLEVSGATPAEQYGALAIAGQLVPFTGTAYERPSAEGFTFQRHFDQLIDRLSADALTAAAG